MTSKFKIYLVIFIISILLPFLSVIFLIRTVNIFIILLIFLSALIFLIISAIDIRKLETNQRRKKYYWPVAIAAVLLFFFSYGIQLTVADWIFLKLRQSTLTTLVSEIKSYNKIREMSDGQRYWKTINNTAIETDINYTDTIEELNRKYPLEEILKRDGVDRAHYELFKKLLIETDLISFTTIEDGTISFTIDGFLDNCYGIAYSETGRKPKTNDVGDVIKWTRIGKNWFAWSTT